MFRVATHQPVDLHVLRRTYHDFLRSPVSSSPVRIMMDAAYSTQSTGHRGSATDAPGEPAECFEDRSSQPPHQRRWGYFVLFGQFC